MRGARCLRTASGLHTETRSVNSLCECCSRGPHSLLLPRAGVAAALLPVPRAASGRRHRAAAAGRVAHAAACIAPGFRWTAHALLWGNAACGARLRSGSACERVVGCAGWRDGLCFGCTVLPTVRQLAQGADWAGWCLMRVCTAGQDNLQAHQRSPTPASAATTSPATMQSITVRAPVAARPATALRSQVGGACSADSVRPRRQESAGTVLSHAPAR